MSSTFFYHFAYQYLREKRLRRAVIEELLVGAVAGVFSRFFTTPLSNLVTRKQTAGQGSNGKVASSATILRDIYNEKGLTGILLSYIFNPRFLVWIPFLHPLDH
jgi:Mitochondrial carrier protein